MDDDKKLNFNRPLLSVRRRRAAVPPAQKFEEPKTGSVTPRLPPPRPEPIKSGPVRDPGVVPFLWEHTPGQPKPDGKPPPARSSDSSGDSDDDSYVDARDTLSRTESFSLNCSVSGLSGQANRLPDSKDVQSRDFVMDRFLPAAKAIASETGPRYLTEKRHVIVRERVKKNEDRCSKPSLRYGPSFAKRYSHDYQEKEDEEESDDDDRHQDSSAACGLLPRFCLRSSLCLLNPVPGMSVRTLKSRKLVDRRIKAAEVDDHKTKSSRRNEPGGGRGAKEEVFDVPELKIHSGTKGFKAYEESNSETPVIEKTLYVVEMESLNLDTTDSSHDDYLKKLKTTNGPEPDAFSISSSIENEAMECLEKQQNYSGHPVPPPLPKSPSDSWLCRTLPSMATKRSSLRLYPQNQFSKTPITKWETIVKTTKESLTTVSET